MPTKRGKWVPPEQLRRDLADRRQQVEADLRQTSAAPMAMFGACDPMVEARLADEAVRIVLHHLNRDGASLAAPPDSHDSEATPDRSRTDHNDDLTDQDIAELFTELAAETAQPPDPLEGLSAERLWVLTDLAVHAKGVARQRATRELRNAMRTFADANLFAPQLVDELHRALCAARQQAPLPLILETLHRATGRALTLLQTRPTPEPTS